MQSPSVAGPPAISVFLIVASWNNNPPLGHKRLEIPLMQYTNSLGLLPVWRGKLPSGGRVFFSLGTRLREREAVIAFCLTSF